MRNPDLVAIACGISGSRRALEVIVGCFSGALSRPLTPRMQRELRRFILHAPTDPFERDRYTVTEQLEGCLRILRGGPGPRATAFAAGLKAAANVLTSAYILRRYGFEPPGHGTDGQPRSGWTPGPSFGDGWELDEDNTNSARAAMVEACRVLRGGNRYYAASVALIGIGGEDLADHAPGFRSGECGWERTNAQINEAAPEARGLSGRHWGWFGA